MIKQLLLLITVVVGLASCEEQTPKEPTKTKLARVGDTYLYFEDIKDKLPNLASEEDSTQFIEFYIQNWIKNQVVVSKSQESLGEITEDINEKVENYRKSLLIHRFEQEYINQNLDTIVKSEEIAAYYNNNIDNFELKDYIVKALYFRLKKEDKLNKKAESWYRLYKYDDNLDDLYKKVSIKTDLFYYDTTKWVYFKDVKSIVPITYANYAEFLKNRKHYKTTEGDFTYYLNIIDYKLKNAVSPLELVKERIKSMILNQRTEAIRKQLRLDLYNHAKKTGQIETYNY